MIFKVHMLAFMDGEIRKVNVPNEEVVSDDMELLERIFYWGQNDFQPVEGICSVSVGDVAEIDGKFYVCQGMGWKSMTKEALAYYRTIPRRDRSWSELVRPR